MGKLQLNFQSGLFKYCLKNLCKEAKCEVDDLKYLREENLLSFKLDKKEYEVFEVNEARFLVSLLRSGLPTSRIKILLQKLEKPYFYSNIYYDFISKSWLEKPITCDEDISKVEEYVEEYFEYLVEEENYQELKRLLTIIKSKLKEKICNSLK
jgi:hypothetical protein